MSKKVILIGLDGAIPEFIEKFNEDLPNTYGLMESGVFASALPSPPADTPTNWTTIATGSWMGTHGINSFFFRIPGDDYGVRRYSFNSNLCQAEYIWETLDKNDKRSIIINYPVAFPIKVERQVVIGGDGPISHNWTIGNPAIYATFGTERIQQAGLGFSVSAKIIKLKKAEGWKALPSSFKKPLESIIPMNVGVPSSWGPYGPVIRGEKDSGRNIFYHLLIYASSPQGYDRVAISREKDFSKALTILHEGEWSGWIYDSFIKDDRIVEGSFRFKLIRLSSDGEDLRLYRSDCSVSEGWSHPRGLEQDIIKNVGPFHEGWEICIPAHHRLRWVGIDVALEHSFMQAIWISKCIGYLIKNYDWDLLMAQIHIHDFYNHYCLSTIEPDFPGYDEREALKSWEIFKRAYKITDNMIGNILKNCVDKNTVTIVVSDHGGIPIKSTVRIVHILIREGLTTYKKKGGSLYQIDWHKTKVFGGNCGFWVNLKGREPHGTVEPGKDYEEVRDHLINILYSLRDPETNKHLVALALRKEDSGIMGMWGERVEDVVYFMEPGYVLEGTPYQISIECTQLGEDNSLYLPPLSSAAHRDFLPSAALGYSSNRALLIISGSGIKEGVKIEKTVNLVDVAPTISYLLGISPPDNAEGRVLHEFLL